MRGIYQHKNRCPTTMKVIHESQFDALRHMRRLGKREADGVANLTVYECPHCHGWHVGHIATPLYPQRKDNASIADVIRRDRAQEDE